METAVTAILFDQPIDDDRRRASLFRGDIFVYSPSPAAQKLCALARTMIEDAFAPHDPRRLDQCLSMEDTAAVLARLKPAFIHHPACKRLLPELIGELGADPMKTYFDVPRLRSAYPAHYLTSGIAYAFHPHRDTWYSAPTCQINWWLPVFDITPENCMAFYPAYFDRPVRNNSDAYNYYEWSARNRVEAAKHVRADSREQPRLQQEIEPEQIRVLCAAGGVILFSGAHLHETVPNTSGVARYSIDFRTVHIDDAAGHRGAPNQDFRSSGTTMRDYLRCTDLEHVSDDVVTSYETASIGR